MLKIYIIAIIVLLTGCSSSLPSESDVGKELEIRSPYASDLKKNVMKIVSITKTNGQTREIFGVKAYEFDYQAELEYTKNVPKTTGLWECSDKQMANPTRADVCNGHNIGDKVTVKDKLMFQLMEKGWKGPSGTVY